MITRPSCRQLVELVALELRTTIAGALTDPGALARLAMIDSVLHTVAARCGDEIAWMQAEISEIERLGKRVRSAAPNDQLDRALEALADGKANSARFDDMAAEYSLAGDVLSVVLEVGGPEHGDHGEAMRILRSRLEREAAILGDFSLTGRT